MLNFLAVDVHLALQPLALKPFPELASGAKVAHLEWNLQTDAWESEPPLFDLFGVDCDRFVLNDSTLLAMKHPDDLATSRQMVESVRGGGIGFSYQHRIFRDDGYVRHINSGASVLVTSNGLPGIMYATIDALSDWEPPAIHGDIACASDGALMLGLRAQMPEAFAETFHRHNSRVNGIARRYFNSTLVTDDVVQDVFENIWRFPARFDARRGSLAGYLAMQARSRCIDIQRSQSRRYRRELLQTPSASALTTEDEVLSMLSTDRVRMALKVLAPEVRRAVELAYADVLSYRAVAERMGIPEGTAKARIRKGLQQLRTSDCLGLD